MQETKKMKKAFTQLSVKVIVLRHPPLFFSTQYNRIVVNDLNSIP